MQISELLMETKRVKEELSYETSVQAEIQVDGIIHCINVTRDEFEGATKGPLEQTFNLVRKMVSAHQLDSDDSLQVITVGGSSYMPQVKSGLSKILPDACIHLYRPEESIAFGAARYASNLEIVLQIAPYSYGVEAYRPSNDDFIICNHMYLKQPLPQTVRKQYSTKDDSTTKVELKIYENSREKYCQIENGRLVLTFELDFGKPVARGTKISIELTLGKDGILTARAEYSDGGKTAEASVGILRS